jgi:hypothetical protein
MFYQCQRYRNESETKLWSAGYFDIESKQNCCSAIKVPIFLFTTAQLIATQRKLEKEKETLE